MSYDNFSDDYDRFVNWNNRLSAEMPFLLAGLDALVNPDQRTKILDSACGTGMHVITLVQQGFEVYGADLSHPMIARAQANALASDVQATFLAAGFGELAGAFAEHLPFDALLCLGNSLPHAIGSESLRRTLRDFADCLRPGGLLIVQNRNFDAVLAQRQRWMEPQSHQEADSEWLFLRFYDFLPNGLIRFNIINLQRKKQSDWLQQVSEVQLYPITHKELSAALTESSFGEIATYGALSLDSPFDVQTSGNLVVMARKQ